MKLLFYNSGSDIDAAEVDPMISSSNSFPEEANNRYKNCSLLHKERFD